MPPEARLSAEEFLVGNPFKPIPFQIGARVETETNNGAGQPPHDQRTGMRKSRAVQPLRRSFAT